MFVHGSYEDQTQGNSVVFRYGKETSVLPRRLCNSRIVCGPYSQFTRTFHPKTEFRYLNGFRQLVRRLQIKVSHICYV